MKNDYFLLPRFFFLLLLISLSCFKLSAQCDNTPKNDCGDIFAGGVFCSGSNIFCNNQVVKVCNISGPASEITNTYIRWGDGICEMLTGCPDTIEHVYNYPPDTCINGGQMNLTVRLAIGKKCGNLESFNYTEFPVVVRFKPVAKFTLNPLTPCAGVPVTIFNNSCPNSNTASFKWYLDSVLISTAQNPTITFPSAGTHEVKLEATNSCGTSTYVQTVTVLEKPVAAIDILSGVINGNTVCVGGGGGIVELSGLNSDNNTTYQWSISPGSSSNVEWLISKDSPVVKIKLKKTGTYKIKLKVSNPCNYISEAEITLTAVEGEQLPQPFEPDGCVPLVYTPNPFLPNAIYTLNGNPVTFPITLTTPGQYVLQGSLTNICGTQTVTDVFELNLAENVAITSPYNNLTLCKGDQKVLLVADKTNVSWQGQHIIKIGDFSYFDPAENGNFGIVAVYQAGTSCEKKDTITIHVQSLTVTANDISVCEGTTSVPLVASPTGGSWTSAACPACVVGNEFVFNNSINYPTTLTYTVFDGVCTASENISLNVVVPKASFSIQMPVCENIALEINTAGTQANEVKWRIDGTPIADQPPFAGLSAGLHTLEQVAILGDCSDTLQQTFNVVAPPKSAAFTASTMAGCSPLTVAFSPTDSILGGMNYVWQFAGGFPADANAWAPASEVIFSNNGLESATYTVRYSLQNECGVKENSLDVQVNVVPVAELGLDSTDMGCSPFGVIITNRTTGQPDSCSLTLGDGFSLAECFDSLSYTFYTGAFQTSFYPIRIWAKNECGESEWVDTVAVLPPGVEAFFEISDNTICPNSVVEFKDASTPKPLLLKWSFGDGSFSNAPSATHSFSTPNDTFLVVLRASVGCGYDTMQHFVVTLPQPEADFDLPPFACSESPVEFENLSDPDKYAWQWDFGDGSIDSTHYDGTHTFGEGGEKNVRLTVTDWNGCQNFAEKKLNVTPKPVAKFSPQPAEGCAPLEVRFADASLHADAWHWVFADGATAEGQSAGKVFDVGAHAVKLIVSNGGTCFDSLTLAGAVRVEDCNYFIPNVFNPSSGGDNSIFTVFGGAELESISLLRVYDSWGELVYEGVELPADHVSGWDGTHRGRSLQPGVFVYYAEMRFAGGEVKKRTGDVTLVR